MEIKCTKCKVTLALVDALTPIAGSIRCIKCGSRYHYTDKGQQDVSTFLTDATLGHVQDIVEDKTLTPTRRVTLLRALSARARKQRQANDTRLRVNDVAYGKVIFACHKAVTEQERLNISNVDATRAVYEMTPDKLKALGMTQEQWDTFQATAKKLGGSI